MTIKKGQMYSGQNMQAIRVPHIVVEGETEIIEEELTISGFRLRTDLGSRAVWAIPFARDIIISVATWRNDDIDITMSEEIKEIMRN
jgi:hypothetical protein